MRVVLVLMQINHHDAENHNADYDFAKQDAGIEFAPTFDLEDVDDDCEHYCNSRSEGVNQESIQAVA